VSEKDPTLEGIQVGTAGDGALAEGREDRIQERFDLVARAEVGRADAREAVGGERVPEGGDGSAAARNA
jgi:hypothetical protein